MKGVLRRAETEIANVNVLHDLPLIGRSQPRFPFLTWKRGTLYCATKIVLHEFFIGNADSNPD